MKAKLKDKIFKKLAEIPDPEIRISIVDLGLIYEVLEEKPGRIKIKMTLTSMGCPFFDLLKKQIEKKLLKVKEVKKVKVELTFDPPWSAKKLSPKAKAQLDFIK